MRGMRQHGGEVVWQPTSRMPQSAALGARALGGVSPHDAFGGTKLPAVEDADDEIAPILKTPGGTDDQVKDYLREIGKTPLLTAEQEIELAKRIEAGVFAQEVLDNPSCAQAYGLELDDSGQLPVGLRRELAWLTMDGDKAKEHLIVANLRLVVSLAKQYTGRGMMFLDLIQEGNMGLIRAVEKFDHERGNKFSTYATWWIKQFMSRAIADQARIIRIPVRTLETINRVLGAQRRLGDELQREPTHEELGREVGMEPGKVERILSYAKEPISLSLSVGNDGNAELGDLIQDADAQPHDAVVGSRDLADMIVELLGTLSPKERDIITMRFGLDGAEPMTYEAIGKVYSVTRERIRQIETKVMARLRDPSRTSHLREYLV